ncbi:hypothetical protein [Methylophilus sp. 14]|uniref:hypothetical protein n=1 Tax=Methylophilus sp. 14 TaxID=2781019 RepID=UPI00188E799E|nr:hypothetical protein [Methylophilus sp. 14]MBF4986960.1 hypothetical protein [Methylophilus sp. 14]
MLAAWQKRYFIAVAKAVIITESRIGDGLAGRVWWLSGFFGVQAHNQLKYSLYY